jgi:hypothetical protein
MSLGSLLALRKARMTPTGIWVLIGTPPKWFEDAEDTIVIRPTDKPRSMDFRAIVGLHVDVIELEDNHRQTNDALNQIEDANPKSQGFACSYGVAGLNEKHERALSAMHRILTK